LKKTENNFSAYRPDLPSCIATGSTREEVEKNIVEAIELHIRGMKEEKLPIGGNRFRRSLRNPRLGP
jgi:predicted RNase H-like HicB family nuclease